MTCPKCGSEDVAIQVVTETTQQKKGRGVAYWLLIGWWLEAILWIFLTIPRLLIAMFAPKRQKLVTEHKSMCLCGQCGNHWQAK